MRGRLLQRNHLIRLLVVSLFILPFVTGVMPVTADTDGLVPNLDIVLVIDESGSMMRPGTAQNDPGIAGVHNGWRFVIADMFTQNWLGLDQSGAQHRVGVVLFGSDAVPVPGGLTPVSDGARLSSLMDGLHDDMEGTNYLVALSAARNMLSNGRQDAKKAIVFLSDGVCEDTSINFTTQECVEQVRGALPQVDVPIYTIAFTSGASGQQGEYVFYTNLLEEMASSTGGLYFRAEKDQFDLALQYENIMRHLMDLPEGEASDIYDIPAQGMDIPFNIEPNVFEVIVTIFKDVGVTEKLFQPDGSEILCGNNASTGVLCNRNPNAVTFSIKNPVVGSWNVRLDGRGRAQIRKIILPKKAFVRPEAFQNPWPAGKPFETSFTILDEDNQVLDLNDVNASLELPNGSIVVPTIEKDNQSTYWIRYQDTAKAGDYKFTIIRPIQSDDISINHAFTVEVKQRPWLSVVEPRQNAEYPTNLPLDIFAEIMVGTTVYPPAAMDKVEVEFFVLDQASLAEQAHDFLQLGDYDTYMGQVSNLPMGAYYALVTLNHTVPNGETFSDSVPVKFTIGQAVNIPSATPQPTLAPTPRPTEVPPPTKVPPTPFPPTPVPTPDPCELNPDAPGCDKTPLILAIIGSVLVLGAGAGGFFWYRAKPDLNGDISMGDGSLFPLSGKRAVTIGSDPKSKISLFGQGVAAKHAILKPLRNGVELTAVDPINSPVIVNGSPSTYALLQDGDTIEIGDQKLTYSTLQGFDNDPQNFDPGDSTGNYSF